MDQNESGKRQDHRDFFISYAGKDKQWAEWIAFQLEEAGYTLFLQEWDFLPGSNFVAEMDKATKNTERTLLVLSPSYLLSDHTFAEWAVAFRHDPRGMQRRLLPVRIESCEVEGLLGSVMHIDLVSLDEKQARERLLKGLQQERIKPIKVIFPGHSLLQRQIIFPGSFPAIWNVPFPRKQFFTGRKDLLKRLYSQLQTRQAAALGQAISGLGGIGKTQLAVEYAYQHQQEYRQVLWAHAETTETLTASYNEIARLLQLPQKDEEEQEIIIWAVKDWLSYQQGWLLILDNADDPEVLIPFLPPRVGGHLIITTRAADLTDLGLGIGHALTVQKFTKKQDVPFLLRRAGLKRVSSQDREYARRIADELDGLPLALNQVGAYLATTGCGLASYWDIHQKQRKTLFEAQEDYEYPRSIAKTLLLSFERVEQRNPAAADLLRFCAFLAPDAIPEELLIKGAKELGPVLAPVAADAIQCDQAFKALRSYSLLIRNSQTRTLTIHRLVQATLRDNMTIETQKQWTQRLVSALNASFPIVEFANWSSCERLLSHILLCATWIEEASLATLEVAHLLNQAGYYLLSRDRYIEAEPLCQRALEIREQQLGAHHPDVANSLDNLAELYREQGKQDEAEPLYQRALEIREQQLGAHHPDTASSLNNLALLYESLGRYIEAEPLYQRALEVYEQKLGATHPETAITLNNLAALYYFQRRYAEAEPLYQRALFIREQQLGAHHLDTATSLNNLAALYYRQEKYREAEPLYQRALAIHEQRLGAMHPSVAIILNNLAKLNRNQRHYIEAERFCQRALKICEQKLGATHPETAIALTILATLYSAQKEYAEAEPFMRRALAIYEQALGAEHPLTLSAQQEYTALLEAIKQEEEPLL